MLTLLWMACSAEDVTADFEARKAHALGDPAPWKEGWETEVALRLDGALVSKLVQGSANAELKGLEPVEVGGLGRVTFTAEMSEALLTKATCEACVGLTGTIEGKARLKVAGVSKDVPFTVRFKGQLEFASVEVGAGRNLTMSLRKVQDLELAGYEGQLGGGLKKQLKGLLGKVDAVDLGPIGSVELPLRDIRLRGDKEGLTIEALATCVDSAGTGLPAWGKQDFTVVLSEGVLLGTARKEALNAGDVSGEHALDIHVEPTSLDVEGEGFTMGLRVWRLEGTGWWRDYTIEGPIQVERGLVRMRAESVEEGDKSPGAAIVDPLSWLGEGFIMDTMAEAAQGGFPTRDAFGVGDLKMTTVLTGVEGKGDALVLVGSARVIDTK